MMNWRHLCSRMDRKFDEKKEDRDELEKKYNFLQNMLRMYSSLEIRKKFSIFHISIVQIFKNISSKEIEIGILLKLTAILML